MNQRGKIVAEVVAMFAIASCLAVYGGYRYWTTDDRMYAAWVLQMNGLRGEVGDFEKARAADRIELDKFKELNDINTRRFDELNKKIEALTGETEKNKKRAYFLNGKLSKSFVFEKPVPVTIIEREPPKNIAQQTPGGDLIKALQRNAAKIKSLSK